MDDGTDPAVTIEPKQSIYWLASYPKSGNTWMRSFITALLRLSGEEVDDEDTVLAGEVEFDINKIVVGRSLNTRMLIEQQLGFDLSDFNEDEIAGWRAHATDCYSSKRIKPTYSKIHDANLVVPDGRPLFSPKVTKGVLYIVRNPLDVAVSYANHSGITIDQSIKAMARKTDSSQPSSGKLLEPVRARRQVRQKMLSWSEHVKSWNEAKDLHILTVRYEDMQRESLATFIGIAEFLELPTEARFIEMALETVRFDKLKMQELEKGFRERANSCEGFFRRGIIGDWWNRLSNKQVEKVIKEHCEVMTLLGYLDSSGAPSDLIRPD